MEVSLYTQGFSLQVEFLQLVVFFTSEALYFSVSTFFYQFLQACGKGRSAQLVILAGSKPEVMRKQFDLVVSGYGTQSSVFY